MFNQIRRAVPGYLYDLVKVLAYYQTDGNNVK